MLLHYSDHRVTSGLVAPPAHKLRSKPVHVLVSTATGRAHLARGGCQGRPGEEVGNEVERGAQEARLGTVITPLTLPLPLL